jgi:hypothetical protein
MSDIFQIGRMNIQADIAPLHPALRPHGERAIVISRTSKARSTSWWSQTGSNRRPPACKAGALPTELWPLSCRLKELSLQRLEQEDRDRRRRLLATPDQSFLNLVGLGRFELPTSRLSSARSNQLSYKPGSRGPTDRPPGIRSGPGPTILKIDDPNHPEDAAARGSSAKKEKRRRRCPANGCAHPENERILMFPRDPIEDA